MVCKIFIILAYFMLCIQNGSQILLSWQITERILNKDSKGSKIWWIFQFEIGVERIILFDTCLKTNVYYFSGILNNSENANSISKVNYKLN